MNTHKILLKESMSDKRTNFYNVHENREIENRIIDDNGKYNISILQQASNYLSNKFQNKKLAMEQRK